MIIHITNKIVLFLKLMNNIILSLQSLKLISKLFKIKKMKKQILYSLIFIFGAISILRAQDPKNWQMLDLAKDGVPGISTNRAYEELLKGRKSVPVVVAVIDGGVDWAHEDLNSIMWSNPGEKPGNNIDDDKNGYVDDEHGWNFIGGKNGKNVNQDNLEVTRIYKKLKYKYEKADPAKLTKDQKAEYDLYTKVKKEVEDEKTKAAEQVDKSLTKQKKLFTNLDLVDEALKYNNITLDKIDSLDAGEKQSLGEGIDLVKRIRAYDPTIQTVAQIKSLIENDFKSRIDYYSEKVKYHYNADFEARNIVGDNYNDSSEKFYGNNDVKGPDADHGTHVSGIIAAVRNNGIGMDGIADNVRIMGVRVVPNGDERDKDVANGIRYAADNGASIINMSFGKGYKWDKKAVDEAVKYAMKKGVLLVHAAGNDNENNDVTDNFPSDKYEKSCFLCSKYAKNWIEVGASSFMNDSSLVAEFSNYGKKNVDVFAPGVAIYSTIPESKYASFQGTSMASPVVAGVAAVLKSYYPGLSAKDIKKIIMATAVKKNFKLIKPGTDHEMVNFSDLSVTGGVVNLYDALKMANEKYASKAAK